MPRATLIVNANDISNAALLHILLHVITHTFHHKGQVVAMLRVLGHPAPDTDLQRG
jgi:uncharacterized damage-inducible protein DinB